MQHLEEAERKVAEVQEQLNKAKVRFMAAVECWNVEEIQRTSQVIIVLQSRANVALY